MTAIWPRPQNGGAAPETSWWVAAPAAGGQADHPARSGQCRADVRADGAAELPPGAGDPAGAGNALTDARPDGLHADSELERLERLVRHLEAERDLAERASLAKTRFLSGMAHELRTPLNGILGHAQLLRLEAGLSAAQSVRVDAMLDAGTHLLQLIHCVLDMTRIETGHVELQTEEVDIRLLARSCLDLVRTAADAKMLPLGLVVDPDVPGHMVTDSTRVRQVLLNLLGNAVKFTARGGVEMRVRTAGDGTWLRLEVADTGPGIPAGQRHRLFREFERLDPGASGPVEGAGIGLALSARVAPLIGGRLGHGDNHGGGSVFWLELPLAAGDVSVSAADPDACNLRDAGPAAPPARSLRVLIVDDNAMNRDIAASFVRRAGHDPAFAEGGEEAAIAAASADFDVILMDVRMPGVDGLEATRRIRAIPGGRGRVPIVAMTAQAFSGQVDECRAAGMDGHLAKPFTMGSMAGALARASGSGQQPAPQLVHVPAPAASLPILDVAMMERTASFLSPETVAFHLRTIAGKCEALLDGLRSADAALCADGWLAEEAHSLVGSAGMFGFARLAAAASGFERAAGTAGVDAPAFAAGFGAALELTLPELQRRAPAAVEA